MDTQAAQEQPQDKSEWVSKSIHLDTPAIPDIGEPECPGSYHVQARVHLEDDVYSDHVVTVTVADTEGRTVDVTFNFYDNTVSGKWTFPDGMEDLDGNPSVPIKF